MPWGKGVVRQFAQAKNRILVGDCLALDKTETENALELMKEAEERKLHKMAQVHDMLHIWPGSQNLMGYTEGITCLKHPNDYCRIHFTYRRDH
jgi:hypothetical protein